MALPTIDRRKKLSAIALAGSLALTGCGALPGGGDAGGIPEEISVLVPYGPGGGTDTWARFMAPYLSEEMGTTLVVENVEGGQGITGTNQYVREADDSGESVLMATASTYFPAMVNRSIAEYEFSELEPLVLNGTGAVLYTNAESGFSSFEEMVKSDEYLSFGGISAIGLDAALLLIFDLFELDVKTTFGFESRGDARLALMRNELNLDYQTTPAYQSQVEPLVEDGEAFPLMSFGVLNEEGELVRDPNFPDVPTPKEIYEEIHGESPSGPAWEAYKGFHAAGFAYQKGMWAGSETPPEVLEAFYEATKTLQNDEEFLAAAENVLGGYPIYAGDEAGDAVSEALSLDEDVLSYVETLLKEEYDTTID